MNCCPWLFRGFVALAVAGIGLFFMISLVPLGFGQRETQNNESAKKENPSRKSELGKGNPAYKIRMFGGDPTRNMVNLLEKKVPVQWDLAGKGKNVKWMAAVGSRAYGGPVIAGGKIYIGTNNENPRDPKVKGPKAVLMCFEEDSGKFLWQIVHDMPTAEIVREAIKDGLCSTPAVDGDRIYYVTPGCELICADDKGKIVWRYDMMKKLKVFPCFVGNCSPLIVGDQIFLITGNGRDGDHVLRAPDAPSFAAFNKKNGKLLWKDNSPGQNILEGQWANPAYGVVNGKPQVIFPGGDGWLYALAPKNGKLIWKFDCNLKSAIWKAGARATKNYIVATPVVYQNRVYIATGLYPDHPQGNGPGFCWCVDMTKTGDVSAELLVDAKATPVKTKPNPNSALVWKFGGKINPVPEEGREVRLGRSISTCAIHAGLVYLAEYEGYLHCLDAKNGTKYWDFDFKSAIWGSPLWVDGKIYIGNEDSDIVIFAHGKKENKLAQIEMKESVPSTPATANGVLYILTRSKLYAIK